MHTPDDGAYRITGLEGIEVLALKAEVGDEESFVLCVLLYPEDFP